MFIVSFEYFSPVQEQKIIVLSNARLAAILLTRTSSMIVHYTVWGAEAFTWTGVQPMMVHNATMAMVLVFLVFVNQCLHMYLLNQQAQQVILTKVMMIGCCCW